MQLGGSAALVWGALGVGIVIGLLLGLVLRGTRLERLSSEALRLKDQVRLDHGEAVDLELKLKAADTRIARLEADLAEARQAGFAAEPEAPLPVAGSETEMWRSVPAGNLDAYAAWLEQSRIKIVTIGSLKGGVGKTTIAANLAAYLDARRGKRVLIIDLDYQGSLSALLLQAAGIGVHVPLSSELIDGRGSGRWLVEAAKPLTPLLARSALVPAGFSLEDTESRVMLRWFGGQARDDVRYNLARVLLSEAVQQAFDVVVIDIGPRLTTAAVNALVASTDLVVPTVLDRISAQSAAVFLRKVRGIRNDLNHRLVIAGVVGTFVSGYDHLKPYEEEALADVADSLAHWGEVVPILSRHIPRRQAIAEYAGRDLAYVKDRAIAEIFDAFGAEVAARIGL